MTLRLLEYNPRGTFSHLLRLPVSLNNQGEADGHQSSQEEEEEELLYQKTLVGLTRDEKQQRIRWHKSMLQSVQEAVLSNSGTSNNDTESSLIALQNLPLLLPNILKQKNNIRNDEEGTDHENGQDDDEEEDEEEDDSNTSSSSFSITTITKFFPCGSIADIVAFQNCAATATHHHHLNDVNNNNNNSQSTTNQLQPLDALLLLIKIIQTVDELHQHGIGHGNLKLENVLVDETGKLFLTDPAGLATATPSVLTENLMERDISDIGVCAKRLLNGMFGEMENSFIALCCFGGGGDDDNYNNNREQVYCDGLLQHHLFSCEEHQEVFNEQFPTEESISASLQRIANDKGFLPRKPFLMDDDDEHEDDQDEVDDHPAKTKNSSSTISRAKIPKITNLCLLRNTCSFFGNSSHSSSNSLMMGTHPVFALTEMLSSILPNENDQDNSNNNGEKISSKNSLERNLIMKRNQNVANKTKSNNNNNIEIQAQHPKNPNVTVIKISNLHGAKLHLSGFPSELSQMILLDQEENRGGNDDDGDRENSKKKNSLASMIETQRELLFNDPARHFLWIFDSCTDSNIVLGDVGGANATVVIQNVENCWMRFGPLSHLAMFDCHNSDFGAPCQFSSLQRCSDLFLRTLSTRYAEEVQENDHNNNNNIHHLIYDCALPDFFAVRCRFSGMPLLSTFLPPNSRRVNLAFPSSINASRNLNFWLTNDWGLKPPHLSLASYLDITEEDEVEKVNKKNNETFFPLYPIFNNNDFGVIENQLPSSQPTYPLLLAKTSLTHDVSTEGNLLILPDEADLSSQKNMMTITVLQSQAPLPLDDDDDENKNNDNTNNNQRCCHAIAIFDVVASVSLVQLHHALIFVASATEIVNLDSCYNCDVYIISARLKMENCRNCRVFAYTSQEAPVGIDCDGVLISEFCLKIPNAGLMASMTSNNNNRQKEQDDDDDIEVEPSKTHLVQFIKLQQQQQREQENENNHNNSYIDQPHDLFEHEKVAFDPTQLLRTISTSLSEVDSEYLIGEHNFTDEFELEKIFTNLRLFTSSTSSYFSMCTETRIMLEETGSKNNFCQHYSIHDISNASVDRVRSNSQLFSASASSASSSSSASSNQLPDFDIFCVDCGHIQISEPINNLRISHCRGGPLTIVAPFVHGSITVNNCANLTLMAACGGQVSIAGASGFCEVSLLVTKFRPIVTPDCKCIEFSPINLSVAGFEEELEKMGVIVGATNNNNNLYWNVCVADDEGEIPVKELRLGDVDLCPIFNVSPPLVGVTVHYNNSNNNHDSHSTTKTTAIPFIAELSDACHDAEEKNEALQAVLVRNLMNMVPGLFAGGEGKRNDNSHESYQQEIEKEDSEKDDDDVRQASQLLQSLRESKKNNNSNDVDRAKTEDDDDDDDEEKEKHERSPNSGTSATKSIQQQQSGDRPMSAFGRSRPSRNHQQQQQQLLQIQQPHQQEHEEGETGKAALSVALDNIFSQIILEAGIQQILGLRDEERNDHHHRSEENPFPESPDNKNNSEFDDDSNSETGETEDQKQPNHLHQIIDENKSGHVSVELPRSPNADNDKKNSSFSSNTSSAQSNDGEDDTTNNNIINKENVNTCNETETHHSAQKEITIKLLEDLFASQILESCINQTIENLQRHQQEQSTPLAATTTTTKPKPKRAPMSQPIHIEVEQEHQHQQQQEKENLAQLIDKNNGSKTESKIDSKQDEQENAESAQTIIEVTHHHEDEQETKKKKTVGSLVSSFLEEDEEHTTNKEDQYKNDFDDDDEDDDHGKQGNVNEKNVVDSNSNELEQRETEAPNNDNIGGDIMKIHEENQNIEHNNQEKHDEFVCSNNVNFSLSEKTPFGSDLYNNSLDDEENMPRHYGNKTSKASDIENNKKSEVDDDNNDDDDDHEEIQNLKTEGRSDDDDDEEQQETKRLNRIQQQQQQQQEQQVAPHDAHLRSPQTNIPLVIKNRPLNLVPLSLTGGNENNNIIESNNNNNNSKSTVTADPQQQERRSPSTNTNTLSTTEQTTATTVGNGKVSSTLFLKTVLPSTKLRILFKNLVEKAEDYDGARRNKLHEGDDDDDFDDELDDEQNLVASSSKNKSSKNNSKNNSPTTSSPSGQQAKQHEKYFSSPSPAARQRERKRNPITSRPPNPEIVASLVCRGCSTETLKEMMDLANAKHNNSNSQQLPIARRGARKNSTPTPQQPQQQKPSASPSSKKVQEKQLAATLWTRHFKSMTSRYMADQRTKGASHNQQIPEIMKIAANGVSTFSRHSDPTSLSHMNNNNNDSTHRDLHKQQQQGGGENPSSINSSKIMNINASNALRPMITGTINNLPGTPVNNMKTVKSDFRLQDDFGGSSNNAGGRNNGNDDFFDENNNNNDNDGGEGGFWSVRENSSMLPESQGPCRDQTLSSLCFDKNVDDSLAELRNKILANALKLKKTSDACEMAMRRMRAGTQINWNVNKKIQSREQDPKWICFEK